MQEVPLSEKQLSIIEHSLSMYCEELSEYIASGKGPEDESKDAQVKLVEGFNLLERVQFYLRTSNE